MLSSYRRTAIAAAAPHPSTSPGVSFTSTETSSATSTASVTGRRGRRVATTTSTASDASTANAGPTPANVRRAEISSRSAMSPRTAAGPSPSASVTWLEPPSAASSPTRATPSATTAATAAVRRARDEPRPAGVPEQRRVAREQDEEPAAVRAEAVPRHGDERERADGDPRPGRGARRRAAPGRAASSRAGSRRRRSGRPATGRTARARPPPGRARARGGSAARTVAQARPSGSSAAARPSSATTHQPASQRFAASARRTTRGAKRGSEDRGEVREAAGEDAQPQPPVVVPLDPAVETLERGDGIVHLDDLEPSVRDVGERHEAGDPRRVRREDTARARRDGDRVARVPALARGRQDDQRVRRRAAIELDQRPPGRCPAEQRALHLAREERVQRALAGDGRAGAGDGEADRPGSGVALERERLDDTDGGGGGRGDHHERDEDRCEAARHGRSLAQCPA